MTPRITPLLILVISPLVIGLGCVPKNKKAASETEEVMPSQREAKMLTEQPAEDGLIRQEIDLNGDGRGDVFNYYRERSEGPRALVRKEVDLNWDGRVDVQSYFTASGEMEKESMDGDFDGNMDWVDHYQGGKRVLSEVDTDYDGRADLWKIYEGGKVKRKERDTDGNAQVDFWEYLDDSGAVVKTGRDIDGDGIMDERED